MPAADDRPRMWIWCYTRAIFCAGLRLRGRPRMWMAPAQDARKPCVQRSRSLQPAQRWELQYAKARPNSRRRRQGFRRAGSKRGSRAHPGPCRLPRWRASQTRRRTAGRIAGRPECRRPRTLSPQAERRRPAALAALPPQPSPAVAEQAGRHALADPDARLAQRRDVGGAC